MDFVEELTESESYNTILIINDQFRKMQCYILARTTWMAIDIANTHINEIWKYFGLPKAIPSDWGPQFVSECWKEINRKLGIIL